MAVGAMFGCTVAFLQKGSTAIFAGSDGVFGGLVAGETYEVISTAEAMKGTEKVTAEASKLELETRQKEKERCKSPLEARNEMLALFRRFDTNASGDIDQNEFKSLVAELGRKLTEAEAEEVFKQLDTDHNEVIDFKEFYTWWVQPKTTPLHIRLADAISSFFSGARSWVKFS